MPGRIKIALVGAGLFATNSHFPALQTHSDLFELVAVYSRSVASAKTLAATAGVDAFADDAGPGKAFDDLLTLPQLQAVIIALPIAKQCHYVCKALQAGIHVISEKPVAPDTKSAMAMRDFYHSLRGNARWIVAENFAYETGLQKAGEVVRSGQLGAIRTFSHVSLKNMTENDPYCKTTWRQTPEHQGGYLLDGGIHQIALLRIVLDRIWPPRSVAAFGRLTQKRLAPIDTLHALFEFGDTEDCARGTSVMSYGCENNYVPTRPIVSVLGSKGSVEVVQTRSSPNSKPANVVNVHIGDRQDRYEYPYSGVEEELRCFGEAIATGKWELTERLSGPMATTSDLQILEALLSSASQGGRPVSIVV